MMTTNDTEKKGTSPPKNNDFINAQYNRLAEDWRHFNNLIWQLPTVAITICSAIIGVAYSTLKDSPWYSKVGLLMIGVVFLLMILIELLKLRLFHNMRTAHLLYIEKKMKDADKDIQPIQSITNPKGIYFEEENPVIIKNKTIMCVLYIDPNETTTGTIKPKTRWMRFKLWFFRKSAFTGQVIAMIIVIIVMIILVIVEILHAFN